MTAITAAWRDYLTDAEAKRIAEINTVLALAATMRAERRVIELRARCRARDAYRREHPEARA